MKVLLLIVVSVLAIPSILEAQGTSFPYTVSAVGLGDTQAEKEADAIASILEQLSWANADVLLTYPNMDGPYVDSVETEGPIGDYWYIEYRVHVNWNGPWPNVPPYVAPPIVGLTPGLGLLKEEQKNWVRPKDMPSRKELEKMNPGAIEKYRKAIEALK